ncbi:Ig-like domain-containing protein [Desulfitobacterium metallireducens]|uniref:SbsA Ig-like domain-containing protein n=1 Tax=Desulfitobacterium metallireducens DSM 15288 TaxID=871968 RepID=W0EC63_9FIRM|nr:Ig-like domain-containing protein [Desulfitobacterium metallireducens]AHF08465.1 hypothetical protein DESME_04025 [Desulfitobacterium metallireducens DSM 15288]
MIHILLKRVHLISLLTVLLCFIGASTVIAGDGNGTGTGSGGGNQNPLTLESSEPADGQKDVNLPAEIKLTFSKNVVNMTVKDKNEKAFTLSSSEGSKIPIEVIMADDQIEPEKNQEVILKPLQDLKPGTAYKVTIAPELKSKSGVSLEKETIINFVTMGTNPSPGEKTNQGNSSQGILIGIVVILGLAIGFTLYKRKH